jgi:hypothetical protein
MSAKYTLQGTREISEESEENERAWNALERVEDDVRRDDRCILSRHRQRREKTKHGEDGVTDPTCYIGGVGRRVEERRAPGGKAEPKTHKGEEAALPNDGEIGCTERAEDAIVLADQDDEKDVDELDEEVD